MRNFVVLLSIVTVLLCPYQCAAKSAAARGIGNAQKRACCGKCQALTTSATNQDQAPAPVAPDETGHSCWCAGAILETGTRSIVDDSEEVSLGIWTIDPVTTLDVDVPMPSWEYADTPPPRSGRNLRITICSLLL